MASICQQLLDHSLDEAATRANIRLRSRLPLEPVPTRASVCAHRDNSLGEGQQFDYCSVVHIQRMRDGMRLAFLSLRAGDGNWYVVMSPSARLHTFGSNRSFLHQCQQLTLNLRVHVVVYVK